MLAFLDFEASSLSDDSYPIEVAWVLEDGTGESYLIRPAPGWTDWRATAEAIHGIERDRLFDEGTPYDQVAARMVEVLSGHDLVASAPTWDGKWMSVLLHAAGLPRQTLKLRDTDEAIAEAIAAILAERMPPDIAEGVKGRVLRALQAADRSAPAHRAMADAVEERTRWLTAVDLARAELSTM